MNFKDSETSNTYMQRLYVRHAFGDKVEATLGKYDQFFGQTGVFFDSEIKGAELAFHANDAANLAVAMAALKTGTETMQTTSLINMNMHMHSSPVKLDALLMT